MSTQSPPLQSPPRHAHPALRGILYGTASAIGYTAANIFLRDASRLDPFFVAAVKNVPVVAMCLVLGWAARNTPRRAMSWRMLTALLITAVVVQIVGNAGLQWSLHRIGLALTIPLNFSTIIAGGAILGLLVLGEPVTPRAALAMLVIVAAVATLSLGAKEAQATDNVVYDPRTVAAAVVVACASGAAYSLSGIVIRAGANQQVSLPLTLGLYSLVGVVILSALALWNSGWEALAATSGRDMAVMFLAGAFNAAAFYALGKALTYLSIVIVNTLNASQAALSAIAGVLLFGEAVTIPMIVGCGLTIAGMMLIDRRRSPVDEGSTG